jgi:hypothetical protein
MESTQTLTAHFGWMVFYLLLISSMIYVMIKDYKMVNRVSIMIPYTFLILFNLIGFIGHIYCIVTGNYVS